MNTKLYRYTASLSVIAFAMVLFVGMTFPSLTSADADTTKALPWGEPVVGLQMAAAFDKENAVIHCWIRNGDSHPVTYVDFFFGYCEESKLEIQQGTAWITFPLHAETFPGMNNAFGAIPNDTKIKDLEPGQIMLDTWERRDDLKRNPYQTKLSHEQLLKISGGDVDLARSLEPYAARQAMLYSISKGDTFTFDLSTAQWSTSFPSQKNLEMRVVQHFFPASPHGKQLFADGTEHILYSAPFVLTIPATTADQK